MVCAAAPRRSPVRRLAAATAVTSCGNGAWYTCWALFLTGPLGLSPGEVAIAITIAGALGLLASAPLGALSDRVGVGAVLVAVSLVQAGGFVAYLAVRDFWALLPVACATVAADRGAIGVRSALALELTQAGDRLRTLALVRTASSAAFALGSALGAIAIAVDDRTAYLAVALANAATFVLYAATVATLPAGARRPSPRGRALAALRDLPYLSLAAIAGVLALCWGMLSSGVPLWIARHTQAPLWISALIVVLNAVTISALQIPVTRRITSATVAARAARRAGAALALSCTLFALSAGRGGAPALLLLLAAATVHVAGELLFVAAAWRLSIDLMPPDAPGEYQGTFATGQAAAQMLAPVLMVALVVGWGASGWLVLAGVFAAAALPASAATNWALLARRQARALVADAEPVAAGTR
jgi:MFS family permease